MGRIHDFFSNLTVLVAPRALGWDANRKPQTWFRTHFMIFLNVAVFMAPRASRHAQRSHSIMSSRWHKPLRSYSWRAVGSRKCVVVALSFPPSSTFSSNSAFGLLVLRSSDLVWFHCASARLSSLRNGGACRTTKVMLRPRQRRTIAMREGSLIATVVGSSQMFARMQSSLLSYRLLCAAGTHMMKPSHGKGYRIGLTSAIRRAVVIQAESQIPSPEWCVSTSQHFAGVCCCRWLPLACQRRRSCTPGPTASQRCPNNGCKMR